MEKHRIALTEAQRHWTKVALLWGSFLFAIYGTYVLSHKIEYRANLAAVALSDGPSVEVALTADKADPSAVTVAPGGTVVFRVEDDSRHDIAEERTGRKDARLDSGEMGQDEYYTLTFDRPGSFSFYDRLNQDIRVSVTIR